MKKINYLVTFITLLIIINGCSGYKPIFNSSNVNFQIAESLIEGDEFLGKLILSKLQNLSNQSKNKQNRKSINLFINVKTNKNAAARDGAGKIKGYKITLSANVKINDYLTNKEILNNTFSSSISYIKQNSYADTVDAEKKVINDLINNAYQKLLIQLTQNINKNDY